VKVILLQRAIQTKEIMQMCVDIANKDMSKVLMDKTGNPIGIIIHENN
jgi:hypothetical protein